MTLGAILAALPSAHSEPYHVRLVGTWMLDQLYDEDEQGRDIDPVGSDSSGTLMFDSNGRFALTILGSVSRFASGDRLRGTRSEYQIAGQSNLSYFGTYTVNRETDRLTVQITHSSFPNWNNTSRILTVSLSDNGLEIVGAAAETLTGSWYSYTRWVRPSHPASH